MGNMAGLLYKFTEFKHKFLSLRLRLVRKK